MKYKHLRITIINWWKLIYANRILTLVLMIAIFFNLSHSSSHFLIKHWSTILVMIFGCLLVIHNTTTTIMLMIKQIKHDQKNVSKINSALYNEFLFKFMKIDNHFNFYLINSCNIVMLIFTIFSHQYIYFPLLLNIFWIIINLVANNIIAYLIWRKSS